MNYEYDVFITHTQSDAAVADRLIRLLGRQKKQNGTALRAVSDGLRQNPSDVYGKIDRSEFLVVLCSAESAASTVVYDDIMRYLTTHTKEKVLLLLCDGEPCDVFPDIMRWEDRQRPDGVVERVELEPLAADIRSTSRRKSLRLLGEESLRIAAPLLGCSFDDLYNRHARNTRKAILTAVIPIMCLAAAFALYNAIMAANVNEQRMRLYEKQSQRLARQSELAFDEGDTDTALKTAREALQDEDKPITPESMAAFRSAAVAHISKDKFKSGKVKAEYLGSFSDNGKLCLNTVENYKTRTKRLSIRDAENPSDVIFDEEYKLAYVTPDFEYALIYTSSGKLSLYSVYDGVKTGLETDKNSFVSAISISKDKKYYAVAYGEYKEQKYVRVYSVDSKKELCKLTPDTDMTIEHMEFEGEKLLVVGSESEIFDISGDEETVRIPYSTTKAITDLFLTEDGLFISTSSMQRDYSLDLIWDIKGERVVFDTMSTVFQYDEERSSLVYQPYVYSDISAPTHVAKRGKDGVFHDVRVIKSGRPNMQVYDAPCDGMDGDYIIMSNEDISEVYNINTGDLVIALNNNYQINFNYLLSNGYIYTGGIEDKPEKYPIDDFKWYIDKVQ